MGEIVSGVAFGVFFGVTTFFLFVVAPHWTPSDFWHGQAIERGYGLYCPMDGEFAWRGECEESDDG